MATKSKAKSLNWNLRVAESEDSLVRAASDSEDTNVTSFVRGAAVTEAKRVLADRRVFRLNEMDWGKFTEQLERPARVPAGLVELYLKPSVFE